MPDASPRPRMAGDSDHAQAKGGHEVSTNLWALRTACWELARKEQEGKRRLQRQMGTLLEGLGNIILDIENGRLPSGDSIAFEEVLADSLERNVYNNTKA